MKIAVCPGSFDPVTVGHMDIVRRAASLFDRVYLCAMCNADKGDGRYPLSVRKELLQLAAAPYDNVVADAWEGLSIDYARKVGACALVKGIRTEADLPHELTIAAWNYAHAPEIETVFFPAREKFASVSSTLVRQKLDAGEFWDQLIPPQIAERIRILERR